MGDLNQGCLTGGSWGIKSCLAVAAPIVLPTTEAGVSSFLLLLPAPAAYFLSLSQGQGSACELRVSLGWWYSKVLGQDHWHAVGKQS